MKKILALSLSAALLLALLGACGAGGGPEATVVPPDDAGESATVPPTEAAQEPSLALPTEEPTEEVPEGPSDDPVTEPSQAPATQAPATQAPATQAPATQPPAPTPSPAVPPIIIGPGGGPDEPTDAPSEDPNGFVEPTGPSASDVDLSVFLGNVFNNYAFPGLDELPTEWIANFFPGLASIPAVQRMVYTPSIGFNTAEIVLVQVADSSDVARVENILNGRIQDILRQQANYIQVVDTWQNNSRIVHRGNYVMLIVHDQCDAIVADFNAALS